jgi:hypothetical protein
MRHSLLLAKLVRSEQKIHQTQTTLVQRASSRDQIVHQRLCRLMDANGPDATPPNFEHGGVDAVVLAGSDFLKQTRMEATLPIPVRKLTPAGGRRVRVNRPPTLLERSARIWAMTGDRPYPRRCKCLEFEICGPFCAPPTLLFGSDRDSSCSDSIFV